MIDAVSSYTVLDPLGGVVLVTADIVEALTVHKTLPDGSEILDDRGLILSVRCSGYHTQRVGLDARRRNDARRQLLGIEEAGVRKTSSLLPPAPPRSGTQLVLDPANPPTLEEFTRSGRGAA